MNINITKLIRGVLPLALLLLSACLTGGGNAAGAGSVTPPVNSVASYTVGGSVTGLLTGGSVVLQNNSGDNANISANGSFTFATPISSGSSYAVTVLTQPTGQTCSVTNGSGSMAGANITNIAINCSAGNSGSSNYNISATVTGLVANTSVVLQDNGGDNLTVSSNSTANFNTALAAGAAYAVTVLTQPTGENCIVTSGSGTVGSTSINVAVICTPNGYTIGGSVTGLLSGHSLVLQDNGGNNLTVTASGSFNFTTPIASGLTYAATILNQPTGQSCSVTNGNGTVAGANIGSISINCSGTSFNVGVGIRGLLSTAVVLQNNGADNLTLTANGVFNFNTPLSSGATFAVTVLTQPDGLTCSFPGGSKGTMGSANIAYISILCAYNNLATFTANNPMGTARYSHSATLLTNGTVLVAGGANLGAGKVSNNQALSINNSEVYDPVTGTWAPTAGLTWARYNHTATLLPNGKVLVSGGYSSLITGTSVYTLNTYSAGFLATAELYDPASQTWSATGSLATKRENHTATLLPNGKVLVTGGDAGFGSNVINSSELYDPATGLWATTGSLATARTRHTATLLANGKVLVVGGTDINGTLISSAELYDPATGLWTTTGSLNTARNGHTATLLPNGKVLVCAGYAGIITNTAELYDPSTGLWSTTGSLAAYRQGHTATLMPSGLVMVSGGLGAVGLGAGYLNSAELYDPANGVWVTNTGLLMTARVAHAATLLLNGKVLISGGLGGTVGSPVLLPNAELFY